MNFLVAIPAVCFLVVPQVLQNEFDVNNTQTEVVSSQSFSIRDLVTGEVLESNYCYYRVHLFAFSGVFHRHGVVLRILLQYNGELVRWCQLQHSIRIFLHHVVSVFDLLHRAKF